MAPLTLSWPTLFLTNAILEGLTPLVAAGKINAGKDADGDVNYAIAALSLVSLPSFIFWRSGQTDGLKVIGLAYNVFHLGLAARLAYMRATRADSPDKNGIAVAAAIHAYMGYNFYVYQAQY
ncbi:hypothetical protein DFJ74DRAFT_676221 [Hyaloraphidium curvatum]|nr:hypothetical protein DFJ74DRAFT_676221 [Hyaloraphidium curvatum]